MAKRIVQGLPVSMTFEGVIGNDIVKFIEGAWGIGQRRCIIDFPPQPEPPTNGHEAVALLPTPRHQSGQNTATRIIARLAETGEPFSYQDAQLAMRAANKKGGPGNVLKVAMENGSIQRTGTGQYVGRKPAAAPAPEAPVSSGETIVDIADSMLKAAYPKPLATLELTNRLKALGRRHQTGSVALAILRKRKTAKRVGVGKWMYKPPKGTKA